MAAAGAGSSDAPFATVKLLTVGNSGVGKSCLILRYTTNKFSTSYITTIGIDFKTKRIDIGGKSVQLDIWDTAGQERFQTITLSYLRGAKGIMLVYDVTDVASFEQTRSWMKSIRAHGDADVNVVLVGNKVDLETKRKVSTAEGQALAKEMGVPFFELSARKNVGVDEAFQCLAEKALDSVLKSAASGSDRVDIAGGGGGGDGGKKRCC
mmetsp:Transcript_15378/g.35342  ORF Transcript_15378/g.35342 Transcript_15378/m.35342 type:complete len:209 (-) Transcript_15378:35-661(-)